MSIGLLVLVIIQGVLGGMRVLMDERTLAKIHGAMARPKIRMSSTAAG